jgi:anaerobic ribonucleoside-triphosphate reductase activating protein
MLKYWNYDIVFAEIPDEVTLAINLTCCPNRCKGCHSPHLQENIGNVLDWIELNSIIGKYIDSITCVCFMGGDSTPFDVAELSEQMHRYYPGINTAWYSGKAELPEGFNKDSFRFIKLGPYIESLGSLESPKTNQRLYRIEDGKLSNITYKLRHR